MHYVIGMHYVLSVICRYHFLKIESGESALRNECYHHYYFIYHLSQCVHYVKYSLRNKYYCNVVETTLSSSLLQVY